MGEIKEIRERLSRDLKEIVERNEAVREAVCQRDPGGNLSFEDLGVEGEFDDVLDSLSDLSRKELLQVWNAIQRIDQGTYGTCIACGRKIDLDRLKAIPATEFCFNCAAKVERLTG